MAIQKLRIAGIIAPACLLAACGGNDTPPLPPQIASTFTTSADGWQGGYSDYHGATEPTDVVWAPRSLTAPLSGSAYYTGGTNRSDDLFIYSKKKFSGYAPSTLYKLSFEIEIATNQSSGCFGVGGSPGASVYVVAGAAPTEPKTVLTDGQYILNLDRVNQATPGAASQVLGNVANAVTNCGPQVYQTCRAGRVNPMTIAGTVAPEAKMSNVAFRPASSAALSGVANSVDLAQLGAILWRPSAKRWPTIIARLNIGGGIEMAGEIIRLGDPTSHGGKVIEGSPADICHGKPIALVGHRTFCPQCKGIFPIIEGAPTTTFYGKGVALAGMKTACGAVLIATQLRKH